MKVNKKILALRAHADVDYDNIEQSSYNENLYEIGSQEYLVLTYKEAEEQTAEQIRESIWAFNTSFLRSHIKLDENETSDSWDTIEDAIKMMQEKLCEGANPIIIKLIDNMNALIKDAVSQDGRGHFLASYDFEETEVDGYYIYRTN